MFFRLPLGLGLPLSAISLLPLSALLSGCGDRDVTLAAAPAPAEAAETPSVESHPAEAEPGGVDPNESRWPEASQWSEASPWPDLVSTIAHGAAEPGENAASGEGQIEPVTPGPVTPGPTTEPAPVEPAPVEPPLDCSALSPVPASFEVLQGFTSSEDFVFDEQGNYVGVDDDNNLVRISKDRKRTLWLPKIGSLAGMGILRDGSVVFCEVQEGAIKRVYPNGAVEVVLGGLLYPNGLDIGPDGFVYVAENNAGRVRRVNPDNGEFSIVALGLQGANGVAFSDDPHLLYVGSFEGSGVYKVEIGEPGTLGTASVFARPPGSRLLEPTLACPDQVEGADCSSTSFTRGKCQALANVIDCLPVDPCPELEDGAYCDYPGVGVCADGRCDVFPTCEDLGVGAPCEDPYVGEGGVCQEIDGGYLYCGLPNPCDGQDEGAACEDPYSGPGTCQFSDGYGYCSPPDPCADKSDGDACEDFASGPGVCRFFDPSYGYCEPVNPCEGLSDGDACVDHTLGEGTCQAIEGYIFCSPPGPCDGLSTGAECEDPFSGPGVCQTIDEYTFCSPPGPCFGLEDGEACSDPFSGAGVCQTVDGYTYCAPPNPCDGLAAGDACDDPYFGEGVCSDDIGTLYCVLPNICLGRPEGEACEDPFLGAGSCQGGVCVTFEPSGGGIDGMGVDACGNVYASEYVYGKVWRISPAGELELLTELPSGWIPNIKWGRGLGGFSSDTMYVADRDSGRLFGVYVGVPGVTEFATVGQ
jgi:sugar lactone lactonase YvrE